MWRKIWTRAHEESKINLRPVFQPDSSDLTLSTDSSFQNKQPVEYYASRPIYRNQADAARVIDDYARAIADYRRAPGSCNAAPVRDQRIVCNGRTFVCNGRAYPNAAALFQEMEQQAIQGGSGAKYDNITIITARN